MGAHAFLAPSSAHRWVRCALSPSLEAQYPEREESPESLEGTAAHWVAERRVRGEKVPEGSQAPNGVVVTEEMIEGAELVFETVGGWDGLEVERKVQIERVHPSENWGTPDYFSWSLMSNGRLRLKIADYKFGFGVVEAVENWQMLDYAAGLLGEAKTDGLQDQQIIVEIVVIQPRAPHRDGPVRRWIALASELRGYFNQLTNAAGNAVNPHTRKPSPTPDGCRNCRGRHACEALQRAAFSAAAAAQDFGAFDLSAHALGLELKTLSQAADLLKARISGLQEEAEGRIKRGELVPFWVLESTPGRLAWTIPPQEAIAYGQVLGLDLAKPAQPITPTQSKALAKAAKLPADVFDPVTGRPSGAVKLQFDDGKKARLTFSSSVTKIEPL